VPRNGKVEPMLFLNLFSTMILKLAANRLMIHKNKKVEVSLQRKKEVAGTRDIIEQ
jgi:hypothetical protein